MNKTNDLIQKGKLTEAIEYTKKQLQMEPKAQDLRSRFVELLCIDGQLERADKQLSLLIKQHPECLIGGSNLRLLIRAAQARFDFSEGAATATLVHEVDESFETLVRMRLAMRENEDEELKSNALLLENIRQDIAIRINGQQCELVRDLDDSLAGYLEVFGTNGKYYLVPFNALENMQLKPVTSLVELIWRKAKVEIKGGLSGEAFIPMTYLASDSDELKLGRKTDWLSVGKTDVYIGAGQKMFLCGDEAKALSQITHLQITEEEMA